MFQLDPSCGQAYAFSLENRLALGGFSGDRCVNLFEHPLIAMLHTTYYEPKVGVSGLKKDKCYSVLSSLGLKPPLLTRLQNLGENYAPFLIVFQSLTNDVSRLQVCVRNLAANPAVQNVRFLVAST